MLSSVSFGSAVKPSQQQRSPSPDSPSTAVFAALDDELRDARRVLSQGQEEDLRCALERALDKVGELSSLLRTALKTQTELETQLNLAKSNLQLVIANNEMLEEALKRETPCNARDVGWRRWSAREVQNHNAERNSEERHRSLDYGSLNQSGTPTAPSSPPVPSENADKPATSTPQPSSQQTNPAAGQESRFFRFRFSSGTRSPALSPHPAHLTSPSLSSLVPNAREKEMEELQEQLERERQAHKAADAAKVALEAELESLSQALFEEANKMVATERMKRAETEEELDQTRQEKTALLQALKLIEVENGQLRTANASSNTPLYPSAHSDSPSPQSSVVLPLQSSSPRTPSRSPMDTVTPPITPPQDGLTDGVPAAEPSLVRLHRKTASMEKLYTADNVPVSTLTESLPTIGDSPPVPIIPDEPSPWADVAS